MEDVAVEVRGENGAYYQAFVREIFDDGHVLVSFENNTNSEYDGNSVLPEQRLPFARIRLPPKPNESQGPFVEGQQVEVYSSPGVSDVKGWWRATVKIARKDLYVIQYSSDFKSTEIVESNRVRAPNPNQPIGIGKSTFHIELPVPDAICDYLNTLSTSAEVESSHREFQRLTGAGSCRFIPERRVLCLILQSEDTVMKVNLLKETHFRSLYQKALLMKKTEEAAKQLESMRMYSGAKHERNTTCAIMDEDALSQELNSRMLEKGDHADFTMVGKDGIEFNCHKCFLTVHSDVFEAMLRKESRSKESLTNRVEMSDMSGAGIQAFLEFLYSFKIKSAEEKPTVALELLKAGNKYMIKPLEEAMMKLFLSWPAKWSEADSVGVGIELFRFVRNKFGELKVKAIEVLKKYSGELQTSENYQKLFIEDLPAAMELCAAAFAFGK